MEELTIPKFDYFFKGDDVSNIDSTQRLQINEVWQSNACAQPIRQSAIHPTYGNNVYGGTVEPCAPNYQVYTNYVNGVSSKKSNKKVEMDSHLKTTEIKIASINNVTWVEINNGRPKIIWNKAITSVVYVRPDPLYQCAPFYRISISDGISISIYEEELKKPKAIMRELAFKTMCGFNDLGITGKISNALVQYIASKCEAQMDCPFYYGWDTSGKDPSFSLNQGRTHGEIHQEFLPVALAQDFKTLKSNCWDAADLVKKITACASAILPRSRGVIMLWFHASVLFSLLQSWDYPIAKALLLECGDARSVTLMKDLFSVFNDKIISLELPEKELIMRMIERKDQPILLGGRGRNDKTHSMLVQIIKSQIISENVSLQAMPVILREGGDYTSYGDSVMILTLSASDFDTDFCPKEFAAIWPQYAEYFCDFVTKHLGPVKLCMQRSVDQFCNCSDEDSVLGSSDFTLMGILEGVGEVIQMFYSELGLDSLPVDFIPQETHLLLQEGLERTSSVSGDGEMMIKTFSEIIRTLIEGNSSDKIISLDDQYIFVLRSKFTEICEEMGVSTWELARLLDENGCFAGKPINANSYETRITIHGQQKRGYKLRCFKLEELLE